jgi:hypothetical protein
LFSFSVVFVLVANLVVNVFGVVWKKECSKWLVHGRIVWHVRRRTGRGRKLRLFALALGFKEFFLDDG